MTIIDSVSISIISLGSCISAGFWTEEGFKRKIVLRKIDIIFECYYIVIDVEKI